MNLKKILYSAMTIGAVGAIAFAASNAFFTDEEVSRDNTFVAGSIDLKLDNESYVDQGYGLEWRDDLSWGEQGGADGIAVGKFFDIKDMKPGDNGEDTISIHLSSNPAWVCVDLEITENSDVSCTDPEDEAEDMCDPEGEGDLPKDLIFAFWKDDGDNVYEADEGPLLTEGTAEGVLGGVTWALADALTGEGPMLPTDPELPYYIGKAWCYGVLEMTPVPQGDYDHPTTEVKGYSCDGSEVGNEGQTDRLVGDITFRAVQARHNERFICTRPDVTMRHVSLENKDASWEIVSDDETWGDIDYSHNDTTFHGLVTGQGLEENSRYQITLNGSGTCQETDNLLASAGDNYFQSGYWNNGSGLEPTCGMPGEGVYNMNLIGLYEGEYTVETDSNGDFYYPFDIELPSGDYSDVKVLVKKTLDTYVAPWTDSTTVHTTNLFETQLINFTVLD